MKYTVLVLYPDYMTSNYGQDTYMAWVEAEGVAAAQVLAQREAYQTNVPPDDEGYDEEIHRPDYHVLLVVEGHLKDLSVQE